MLIATLVNRHGKRAVVEVPEWRSEIWPASLLDNGRLFQINVLEGETTGAICTATYHETSHTRCHDISNLPKQQPRTEQEEAA
jgi:hypothetical protein